MLSNAGTWGPSIKDVRRDGGRSVKCGQGVEDIADVRKLVLFFIVSACFADASIDNAC